MITLSWLRPDLAVVRIARSERGNAFDAALVRDLQASISTAEGQSAAQTLAFVAQGQDFSTGMDLSHLEAETDSTLAARFVEVEALLASVWSSRLHTVACVQGRAWGAAADLVVACDLRLALPNASFRFPGAQFGLVLGTRRLACRIGSDRARQIVLGGLTLPADHALQMGLIHGLVETFDPENLPALVVDSETQKSIHAASRAADDLGMVGDIPSAPGTDPGLLFDLHALVESVRRPGLRQRILDYRARLKGPAGSPRP